MATTLARPGAPAPMRAARPEPPVSPRRHAAWLAGAFVLSFLVPYVVADRLGLQRDVYYGVYVAAVAALCIGWMRDTRQSPRELLGRRLPWALGLGAAFAALAAVMVVRTEDATAHPDGIEFVGALLWRGLVYGTADGLLLTAFPIVVVFAALSGSALRRRRGGVVAVGAIALVASMLMTATYHLGYEQFRSDELRKPVAGDLLWSPPTLLTVNPVGAPIVHASMHVSAVAHSYDTDVFLPPH